MVTRAELLAPFYKGGRSPEARVAGTEYECLVRSNETGMTVPYDGPAGIKALLEAMGEQGGWEPMTERGTLIGMQGDNKSITLEPGGQFELSGAPLATLAETQAELDAHLMDLAMLEERFPVTFNWFGINPWQTIEEIQWMPKGRYAIMRRYLPTRGDHALHMMGLTCTVQANLDYIDEADFARKLRVSSGISSLVTSLFANSRFLGGEDTGFQSYRAHVWTRMDPDRSGLHRFVFETDAGFDEYTEFALDVPLFFLCRDAKYVDVAGKGTFRDLMEGRLEGYRAEPGDWPAHLSTLFIDVRARPHLEMRACDCVPPEAIVACPGLWKGILYDEACTDAAWDLVKRLSFSQRRELALAVPRTGIRTRRLDGRGTVQDLCVELVAIAAEGLRRQGENVECLAPLEQIAGTGRTYADQQGE